MSWMYWTVYAVGAPISARLFYAKAFKIDYEDSVEKGIEPEEKRIHLATRFGLYFAWLGLLWPLAWIFFILLMFIIQPTNVEKDIEKRKQAEAEQKAKEDHEIRVSLDMQRLRAWLEENKMEAPDTATLRFMAEERVNNNEDID